MSSSPTGIPARSRPSSTGSGTSRRANPNTGEPVAGPVTLSPEELAGHRIDLGRVVRATTSTTAGTATVLLTGPTSRSLSSRRPTGGAAGCTAWQLRSLHRGGVSAEMARGARPRALDALLHRLRRTLQRRFFDHFLKGTDNGWDRTPAVRLNVRRPGEHFELREEHEWPLARTSWTKLYLDVASASLLGTPRRRGRRGSLRSARGRGQLPPSAIGDRDGDHRPIGRPALHLL